jgi:hypothetical protein
MRTIFEFSTENAKSVDWLADDAVCCELLSVIEFPDHQGKYRELRAFEALLPLHLVRKSASPLAFFRKFPTQQNREFCLGIREVKFPDRLSISEISSQSGQPHPNRGGTQVLNPFGSRSRFRKLPWQHGASAAPNCTLNWIVPRAGSRWSMEEFLI